MAMSDPIDIHQVRRARGRFAAMAGTYTLGVFNDNFYKQAVCLLAVAAGRPDLQGYAAAIFTLPFIFVAAPAGWLADRFSKRHVVVGAKVLELVAMLCGAAGILLLNWPLVLVMVGLMALQSTLFSPALNGAIPELYPAAYVLRANSILKMSTTLAILVGIILAGVLLGVGGTPLWGVPWGRWLVAFGIVGVSAVGIVISLFVPKHPAADPAATFPWHGLLATWRTLRQVRADSLLFIVIMADAFVWFIAAAQILLINAMGITQFGLGEQGTSYLLVAELAGVAVGGWLCGKLDTGPHWFRVLAPAATLLAAAMGAIALVPQLGGELSQLVALYVLLGTAGLAGGVMLVPLESFIQTRPEPGRKGAVISAANAAAFTGILVAGIISIPLNQYVLPTYSFALLALVTLPAAVWLHRVTRGRAAT